MSMSANLLAIPNEGSGAQRVRRLLVPLDGSRHAAAALPHAIALAHVTAAHIILLAIVDPPQSHAGLSDHTSQEQHERQVALNAGYLESVAASLRERGLSVEATVRYGDPASAIVAASAEEGGALVVMGTHGRTGLARLRMGSVAQRVLRRAAVATLVVPPGAAVSTEGAAMITAITVALDGSALAEEALPLATSLATALGVPLELLSMIPGPVIPYGDDWDDGYVAYPPANEARERADEGAIASYLEAIAVRLRASGLVVRTAWAHGVTSQVDGTIAAYLAQQPTGLAVMASHGRGGVLRWVLGSTAEGVLDQAPCPVLIVRADAAIAVVGEAVLASTAHRPG